MNTSKAKSIMHLPFFGIIFLLINEIVTQELTLCPLPRINSKCVLTCKTPNLEKTISFIEQGNILGSCEVIENINICETFNNNFLISQNKSASETYLTIQSTNENDGFWHCEYDKRQSQSKKLELYGDDKVRYLVFNVLPYGVSIAAHIFTKATRTVVRYCRGSGLKIIMYLDDGLGGASTQDDALQVSKKDKSLGLLIADDKSSRKPSQNATWLGLLWNFQTDIMYHTSLVNIPIVHETGNLISINFQTDCLMPEPTSWLHCKNGEEMCKVSPFKKRKCEKPSLRIYSVTCYTTSECHLETESKVDIKVYDYIIDRKIITHGNEQKQITVDNENGTSLHDGIPTMLLPIIVILLVSLLL